MIKRLRLTGPTPPRYRGEQRRRALRLQTLQRWADLGCLERCLVRDPLGPAPKLRWWQRHERRALQAARTAAARGAL